MEWKASYYADIIIAFAAGNSNNYDTFYRNYVSFFGLSPSDKEHNQIVE